MTAYYILQNRCRNCITANVSTTTSTVFTVDKRKVTSFRFSLCMNCFLRNYPASASVSSCSCRHSDEKEAHWWKQQYTR